MHLEPGLLLGGRYRLEQRLASGGMGEVWRAADSLLGRAVAVKVPRPELAADPAFGEQLLVEARHAAAVVHPGIAAVYDVHAAEPVPYLVLELVAGRPLSRLLAEDGPLPVERVRHLLCQVAAGLAAAHAAGLVHRDVKPANLLVTQDDTVKVTDFGISRAADAAAVTRTGFVVGTAQYLSPEQAGGRPATPASDMYALGVVAHELLTGRRPFEGEPLSVLRAHREQAPPPLPQHVVADLRTLVSGLLDKDPSRRPTARQVSGEEPATSLLALEDFPAPDRLVRPSRPAVLAGTATDQARARPRLVLAGVGAAVGVVAVLGAAVLAGLPGSDGSGDGAVARAEAPAPPAPVPVASVSLFHPGGSDDDNAQEVPLAVDGDPGTAWTTQRYASPQFGNLRPGVGLLLDLGEPREVSTVQVDLASPGLSLRLHAGAAPDPAVLDSPPLAVDPAAPAQVSLTPAEPVTAQFFVLWIDRLPEGGGRPQAAISEIALLG